MPATTSPQLDSNRCYRPARNGKIMQMGLILKIALLILLALGGCSVYRVNPVDVRLQNNTSLPFDSIELERHTYAYKSTQLWFEVYERELIDNRQSTKLDSQGQAHLPGKTFLYQPSENSQIRETVRLVINPPESVTGNRLISNLPAGARKPDLACSSKLPAVCRNIWKGNWQLVVTRPEHDLMLTERTVRLVLTTDFSRFAEQMVSRHGIPPRFILEYKAWQKGAPVHDYGCNNCTSVSPERDLWIQGRRSIDLAQALKLQQDMVIEMPVFILTSRQQPELEERIRIIADLKHLTFEEFDFPVRKSSNNERVSEVLLNKERYEWLAPRIRKSQDIHRMFDAIYAKNVKLVAELLAAGLPPHTLDQYSYPLFYRAAQIGTPEVIQLFRRHGATVEGACKAMINAAEYKRADCAKELTRLLKESDNKLPKGDSGTSAM
jgi:hypothetical protein